MTYVLAAVIGGTAGTGVQLVTPTARNDPFTGEMAKRLANSVSDQIIAMGVRIDRLEKRLDGAMEKLATLPERELINTVAEMKADIKLLRKEQQAIERLLRIAEKKTETHEHWKRKE